MDSFAQGYARFIRSAGPGSRFRLAPTPSGFLHAGNAVNFTLNWLAARLHPGARVLLRIDDLDADRKRPEYVQDIFDTLNWLGLDWDEGPRDPDDFENNWSQHLRLPLYFNALDELRGGGYLFACGKSRRDLERFQGKYPPEFRNQHLSLDDPNVAWRVRTPEGFPLPDFIVRRRDGIPAYQLASVADDLHFGITHVIRGADLEESTAAQLFLAECLNRPDYARIQFLHHPLLKDDTGMKLSKSAGASALRQWRAEGRPAEQVFKQTTAWLGMDAGGVIAVGDLLRECRKAI
ncbi:MAG: glutamate--tRNA ligase family protein [Thermoanaerobaculia bacterium]|nr:glutamate--tRNA ligase family protein [Thermoanaerobaculia bacterium]